MFKLALCQIKGSFDKKESMATVTRYVETAAENGAQVISLPEMWNCPYSNDYFREYAEAEDGPTVKFLSDLAAKHDIYLIGGSDSRNWMEARCTTHRFLLIAVVRSLENIAKSTCSISM